MVGRVLLVSLPAALLLGVAVIGAPTAEDLRSNRGLPSRDSSVRFGSPGETHEVPAAPLGIDEGSSGAPDSAGCSSNANGSRAGSGGRAFTSFGEAPKAGAALPPDTLAYAMAIRAPAAGTAPVCEGEPAGNYCAQPVVFSSGASTISCLDGLQPSIGQGTLILRATGLPAGQPGKFIAAPSQQAGSSALPFVFNNLCIDQFNVLRLGTGPDVPVNGVSTLTFEYANMVYSQQGQLPFPGMPGESWSFQRWNRDPANTATGCIGGACASGFSDAITLCFAP